MEHKNRVKRTLILFKASPPSLLLKHNFSWHSVKSEVQIDTGILFLLNKTFLLNVLLPLTTHSV